MNETLNLVEILKDCPKGTKLWSPLCGDCELFMIEHGEDFPVVVYVPAINRGIRFTEDGKYFKNGGVCVLFPSREQLDWSNFQRPFKDGDVIYVETKTSRWVSIFNNESEKQIFTYTDYNLDENKFYSADYEEMALCLHKAILEKRFATEEEKQKLFQAIKDNGHKWNAVTKTLEKLVEPKFDPATLKPFDRVLVRDAQTDKWRIGFFEKIDTEEPKYDTAYSSYRHCIPYLHDTKHLLGKAEMEPEYYQVDEYLL